MAKRPAKTAAETARARELQGYRDTARDLANALPLPDLIQEVKNIGKRRFAGTSFDQEAIIFCFLRRFHALEKEVALAAEKERRVVHAAIAAYRAEVAGHPVGGLPNTGRLASEPPSTQVVPTPLKLVPAPGVYREDQLDHPPLTLQMVDDMLQLVSITIPPERMREWTPDMLDQAFRWAGQQHLIASDNEFEDHELLERPWFLEPNKRPKGWR